MGDKEYWRSFYNDINAAGDAQQRVFRTKGGESVNEEVWSATLDHIAKITSIKSNHRLLEPCCGNGLISGHFSKSGVESYGIDFSSQLIEEATEQFPNLHLTEADVLEARFPLPEFDVIIIYFSIQYFNEKEALQLIAKCTQHLTTGGKLFIGDIPDDGRKWAYLSKPEYRKDYLDRIMRSEPLIGNWFQREFFEAIGDWLSVEIEVLDQPEWQINAAYRFDCLITKLK